MNFTQKASFIKFALVLFFVNHSLAQVTETTITTLGVAEYTPEPIKYRIHIYMKKYNNVDDVVQYYKNSLAFFNADTTKVGQATNVLVPDMHQRSVQNVHFYYDADTEKEVNEITSLFIQPIKYNGIEVFYGFQKNKLEQLMRKASKNAEIRAELLAQENGRILGKLIHLSEMNTDYVKGFSEPIEYKKNKKNFIVKAVFKAEKLHSN